jgi:hypothetical protein
MKCDVASQEIALQQSSNELQQHLSSCSRCREEQQQLVLLTAHLKEALPPLPTELAFSMMPDRVWAQLESQRKQRSLVRLVFGLATCAAVLLCAWLVFMRQEGFEESVLLEELAVEELFDEPESIEDELETLTEDELTVLGAKLPELPKDNKDGELFDGAAVPDELDVLTPEELEQLDALLTHRKKG